MNDLQKLFVTELEALLVNRLNGAREYYRAPIDVCFELVGLIRLHWRGFSGGDKVWQEINAFFAKLDPNSTAHQQTQMEASHA
jgi:hypothetical protein